MTTLEMGKTSVLKKLVQIQGKVLWCEFKKISKSARLNNEISANKDKVDKDEVNKDKVDKNKAESYMIVGLLTLTLQLSLFLV